jgi:hypothetical protein
MANQRGGEVLRDTCALTLGDEPLAGTLLCGHTVAQVAP